MKLNTATEAIILRFAWLPFIILLAWEAVSLSYIFTKPPLEFIDFQGKAWLFLLIIFIAFLAVSAFILRGKLFKPVVATAVLLLTIFTLGFYLRSYLGFVEFSLYSSQRIQIVDSIMSNPENVNLVNVPNHISNGGKVQIFKSENQDKPLVLFYTDKGTGDSNYYSGIIYSPFGSDAISTATVSMIGHEYGGGWYGISSR